MRDYADDGGRRRRRAARRACTSAARPDHRLGIALATTRAVAGRARGDRRTSGRGDDESARARPMLGRQSKICAARPNPPRAWHVTRLIFAAPARRRDVRFLAPIPNALIGAADADAEHHRRHARGDVQSVLIAKPTRTRHGSAPVSSCAHARTRASAVANRRPAFRRARSHCHARQRLPDSVRNARRVLTARVRYASSEDHRARIESRFDAGCSRRTSDRDRRAVVHNADVRHSPNDRRCDIEMTG
ncbi:MAG TPA: hypothetical protein VNS52_16380 [Gemmatimonadaceae bacterium]|nr:hypothetical protein [Gemmatimonadaceae bacterium]